MTARAFLSKLAKKFGFGGRSSYVDQFDATRVAGWAFDPVTPDDPVLLCLYVDGKAEMNIVADVPRQDVHQAGLGPLRCGFDVALPRHLRDGRGHTLHLRLGVGGPLLRNGTLVLHGDTENSTQAPSLARAPQEGVAFYDSHQAAIVGWAVGCTSVGVTFDSHPPRNIPLDREVAGFDSGLLLGFRVAIPAGLQDGREHEARVCFGSSQTLLDGAPVRFSQQPERLRVELAAQNGDDVTLQLRAPSGALTDLPVLLHVDGNLIEGQAIPGGVVLALPPGACHLVVTSPEQEVLARFSIRANQISDLSCRALPPGTLAPERLEEATRAFAEFCAAPDDRFEPLWYRWHHVQTRALTQAEDLLVHYRDHGAARGHSPGPLFDEAAARTLYPTLRQAIEAGKLPCAFALELILGPGALDTLPGGALRQRKELLQAEAPQAEQVDRSARSQAIMARLPVATQAQTPAESIYAAWMLRLDIPDDLRADLAQEEYRMRAEVTAMALCRAPLISIIMPSWNRAYTIAEAIQSVLEQSYSNWELIICDDASDDRTSDVVRGFDDPRIRYMKFLKSNGAGARNKGLRHACGEYIAYLDSDNIWHPLFLDMMMRHLLANPGNPMAYSAYLDTVIEGAKVRLDTLPRPPFRPIQLSSKNFIDLNTVVHHRQIYDWLGGFDAALPRLQDWDLVLRYTSLFRPIFVNRPGVFYRRNLAWGQVTHLFMGSQAQATVAEKTRRRLEVAHERLPITWPERSRITILFGDPKGTLPVGDAVLATALARMASQIGDVDLIDLTPDAPSGPALEQGVIRHNFPAILLQDKARLSAALAPLLLGRPVICVGASAEVLQTIGGLDPVLSWSLVNSGHGSALRSLESGVQFDLGALPLRAPDENGARGGKSGLILVLLPALEGPEDAVLRRELAREAKQYGLRLLLPPRNGRGWELQDGVKFIVLEPAPQTGLPEQLAQVVMTVSLAQVADLTPLDLALLNMLHAQAVPAAVPSPTSSAPADCFGRQWIEARAVFEIKRIDPDWVFSKLAKLLADAPHWQRLCERSQLVHRIAWHPELLQQRLGYALYRILHDFPHREVHEDVR